MLLRECQGLGQESIVFRYQLPFLLCAAIVASIGFSLSVAVAGDRGVKLETLVENGSLEELAAYLATPGVDINARPNARPYQDKALLDYAAEVNKVEVAAWLLDHGADINAVQQTGLEAGLTALHRAAFFDALEVAQLLIARGADVNANRAPGRTTPLFYAASAGHVRIVELLLQHGADVAVRSPAGATAASAAAQQGHLDVLKLLQAHGATLSDDLPLSEAAANQHADIVRYLLDRGQSQSAKDDALRFAVLAADRRTDAASLDLVSMLLASGANVNNTGKAAFNTPLMMATRAELRELLVAHGARDLTSVEARGTPGSQAAASIPPNVQVEQHGPVTSMTIPGQLAPTQNLECIAIGKVKATATPPDLYRAARACVDQGDYERAVPLFLLGGAYGRFDAARVADQTAGQGIMILIMGFGSGLRDEQKQAFTTATSKFQSAENKARLCKEFKRLGPPDYFPRYMILHGIKAFTTADPTANALVPGFDAAVTWRRLLAEGLNCTADGR
jgi:ankyrin repeat protein